MSNVIVKSSMCFRALGLQIIPTRYKPLPMCPVRTRVYLVVREGLEPAASPSRISKLLINIARLSPGIPPNPQIWHSIWHCRRT
jgi:hypothetical protein